MTIVQGLPKRWPKCILGILNLSPSHHGTESDAGVKRGIRMRADSVCEPSHPPPQATQRESLAEASHLKLPQDHSWNKTDVPRKLGEHGGSLPGSHRRNLKKYFYNGKSEDGQAETWWRRRSFCNVGSNCLAQV